MTKKFQYIVESIKLMKKSLLEHEKWHSTYYFLITILLFVLLCLLLGHPAWIITVLAQNTMSDLTGETPRLLALTYFDTAIYQMVGSIEFNEQTIQAMVDAMLPSIPTAFLFSSLDSFIADGIKTPRFMDKIMCFTAGYCLQAIIAVACMEPVTWQQILDKTVPIVVSVWILGGITYLVYCLILCGNIDLGKVTTEVTAVMMAVVYAIARELFKLTFLIAIFSGSVHALQSIMEIMGLTGLLTAIAFISVAYYILLNRLLDKVASKLSNLFLTIVTRDTDVPYRQTYIGNAFCFFTAAVMHICAVFLQFIL